ncbi:PIN domain-containing protein [Rhodoferax sp.]|uniref:PIN domain-containing protein n=1 Tax=Rhodoferax sp. TaxID=50421 RepID=UPI00260A2C5D|nr:PIN domain-containing protein [Rhodoferax sp.]MDD2808205.1 PIN domain-containing protein [Rhodoferax sp.]MDD4942002.1 PIN domain-containing protein [Rhodoferax sp.]MDD5480370.1 PIN domain-containing protein [Rhodoferax sp.]
MTVKAFLDTNIVLYAIGQDAQKRTIARQLIAASPMVNAQVINESVNVCLKKLKFDKQQAYAFAETLMNKVNVLPVDETVIRKSAEIAIRHQLSNWDALIIAAALLAGCETVYSEDMQHGQIFETRMTVINPF